MSVHEHPMAWAREMETLLGNGTINKDNYLTDCANAVVYVRESAEKIASARKLVADLIELALEWKARDCAFKDPGARYMELKQRAIELGLLEGKL